MFLWVRLLLDLSWQSAQLVCRAEGQLVFVRRAPRRRRLRHHHRGRDPLPSRNGPNTIMPLAGLPSYPHLLRCAAPPAARRLGLGARRQSSDLSRDTSLRRWGRARRVTPNRGGPEAASRQLAHVQEGPVRRGQLVGRSPCDLVHARRVHRQGPPRSAGRKFPSSPLFSTLPNRLGLPSRSSG